MSDEDKPLLEDFGSDSADGKEDGSSTEKTPLLGPSTSEKQTEASNGAKNTRTARKVWSGKDRPSLAWGKLPGGLWKGYT